MQQAPSSPSCFEALKRSRSKKPQQDAIDEPKPFHAAYAPTTAALIASPGGNPQYASSGVPTPQFGPTPFSSPLGQFRGDAKPLCSWNTQYTPDFGPSELKLDVGTLPKASEASVETPEFGAEFLWQQDSYNCGALRDSSAADSGMHLAQEVNQLTPQQAKLPTILGMRRDMSMDKLREDSMTRDTSSKAVSSRPAAVPRLAIPPPLDPHAAAAELDEVETSRFDFGPGLAQCYLCGSYPCFNRGCQICRLRICKHCFPVHKCTVVASMDDFIVVHELSTPRDSPRSPRWSPRSERPSWD